MYSDGEFEPSIIDSLITLHQRPAVPLVGAKVIDTKDKLETTFGTTIARKRDPDIVEQLQREAEDVIAWYGDLFKDAAPTNPTRPSPLQPRNSALVRRTSKAGDRNVASLPYPSGHPQSKRTRVPGCYVCTWAGCSECKYTQMSFHRRIVSEIRSQHSRGRRGSTGMSNLSISIAKVSFSSACA